MSRPFFSKSKDRWVQSHYADRLIGPPKKNKSSKGLKKTMASQHNDDSNLFHSEAGPIVLGVYGAEDWIESDLQRRVYLEGKSLIQLDGTWLTNSDFDLTEWVKSLKIQFSFFRANSVTIYDQGLVHVKIKCTLNKIEVEIRGETALAQKWFASFNAEFTKAENLVQWVYNSRGDEVSIPLNYRPAIRSAYPWIDQSYSTLDDYIDDYTNSSASVLILMGPPGTGKTTFIKNIIHRSKADAKVAYDPKVMMGDGFFAGFIEDDTRFLVMEDADEFLKTRTEGNTMMHKFLNVSDGLISAADKKIVFSTNLQNIGDIDEALMREGRCFDILQFRLLTREEALAVLNEAGSTRVLPDGAKFTLAKCFNDRQSSEGFLRRNIGF